MVRFQAIFEVDDVNSGEFQGSSWAHVVSNLEQRDEDGDVIKRTPQKVDIDPALVPDFTRLVGKIVQAKVVIDKVKQSDRDGLTVRPVVVKILAVADSFKALTAAQQQLKAA